MMNQSRQWVLALSLVASLASISPASAGECDDCGEGQAGAAGAEGGGHRYHRRSRGAGVLVTRYMGINTNRFEFAFTNNGFEAPASGAMSWGGLGYWMSDSGWQLGGGGFGAYSRRRNGAFEATFGMGYGGFYGAKLWQLTDHLDATLGSLLGGGGASVTVFGPARDGRLDESFFVVEPTLTASARVARWLKIGLWGSYFVPIGGSTEQVGDGLGITSVAGPAWSAGLQFVFGRFGTRSSPSGGAVVGTAQP